MASSDDSTHEGANAAAAAAGTEGTHSNLKSFLDSVTPVVKAYTLPMESYLPLVSISRTNFFFFSLASLSCEFMVLLDS